MSSLNQNQNIGISVSICLFCYTENQKKVLTVINNEEPYKGALILPNKILNANESLEDVCSEILKYNIGNSNIYVEQLNAFGKLYRHPNGRIICISFYGLINLEKDKVILNEKSGASFTGLDSNIDLAFDHNDMINMALKRIKRRMKYRPLGKNLLPDQFTMNELEGLYASFLSKNLIREISEEEFSKWIS